LFPYARWKPGSLIYPYILKKEERIKNQFLDQPEKMLEQHLFFAAKRITEIQKWNKKFSDEQVIEVLARYKNEMQAAIKDLDTIRQTGEETFMLLAKIEVAFGAHQQRLLDVIEGDYVDKDTRIKLVKTIVFDIGDQLKGVRKKYSQIKYYFEVPQSGEYEILVEDLATSSNWQLENVTPGTSDKFITSVSGPQSDEQWLSFGKRYFDQGRYWLELIQPASQILLAKDWQKVETEIELDKENKFSTEMRHPTIYHDIKNWQPQTTYKLSFKYKTDGGKLKIFLVEEKGTIDTTWFDKGVIGEPPDKFNVLVEQRLESEDTEADEWWDFSIVVNSDRNTKTAKLSIGNEANNSSQTNIVTLKDVWLKAIVEPQIILKKIGNVQHRNVPKITFQKTNPTKYIINVENATSPYFLIFSESFHRGWKAYIKEFEDLNGETVGNYFAGQIREIKAKTEFFDKYPFQTWYKKPLSVDKHVIMNGYANSWYITPEDVDGQTNYQIVVEYQGQWLFYIGVGVTLITMIGSLGFYLLWNIKHAKKS